MKVVFIHIPKTGGGSVFDWWNKNLKDSDFQLIRNKHCMLDVVKEPYDTSFTITRNTFDRLISLYSFVEEQCYKAFAKKRNIKANKKKLEAFNKGLIYYINYAFDNSIEGSLSQIDYIKGVDHIFKTETLKNDFKKIQQWANCSIPLRKNIHVGKYNKKHFMTPDFIKLVSTLYEKEIEYFNYKPIL